MHNFVSNISIPGSPAPTSRPPLNIVTAIHKKPLTVPTGALFFHSYGKYWGRLIVTFANIGPDGWRPTMPNNQPAQVDKYGTKSDTLKLRFGSFGSYRTGAASATANCTLNFAKLLVFSKKLQSRDNT